MQIRGKRRMTARALAVVLAATGGVVVAAPAANADEAPGCVIRAQTNLSFGWVDGFGIRSGCVQRRELHVLLREDVNNGSDRTLDEQRVPNVINTVVHVSWPCSGFVNKRIYTEIRTSAGGKEQSVRVGPFQCT